MSLTIRIDLPTDVEEKLRSETSDLAAEVKEVYALELFRRGRLSHYDLARVLGLDRHETDAYLKRHQVFGGSLTMEDIESDFQNVKDVLSKSR
jgi:predicted HTH domain antitoxin